MQLVKNMWITITLQLHDINWINLFCRWNGYIIIKATYLSSRWLAGWKHGRFHISSPGLPIFGIRSCKSPRTTLILHSWGQDILGWSLPPIPVTLRSYVGKKLTGRQNIFFWKEKHFRFHLQNFSNHPFNVLSPNWRHSKIHSSGDFVHNPWITFDFHLQIIHIVSLCLQLRFKYIHTIPLTHVKNVDVHPNLGVNKTKYITGSQK